MQPTLSTSLAIGFALAVASTGVFAYLQYRANLVQFRDNLRPGELCRVKTSGGIVNARILKRNSAISFVAAEIDSKKHRLTTIENIYLP